MTPTGRPIGGISSERWSAYVHDQLGLGHLNLEEIRAGVIDRMVALPGARTAAARGPLRPGFEPPPATLSRSNTVLRDLHGLDDLIFARGLG
jgi:hypothetical protein